MFGSILGGITSFLGGRSASKAAQSAGRREAEAGQYAADLQQQNFQQIRNDLQPYRDAGSDAIAAQRAMMGLDGAAAQQQYVDMVANMPEYQTMLGEANRNMLAQGSATGQLRGGNIQRGLGLLAPEIFNNVYQNYYGNLGALAGAGMGAATQTGQFGTTAASNMGNAQLGAAQAMGNSVLQRANVRNNMFNIPLNMYNEMSGMGGLSGFGGFGGGGGSPLQRGGAQLLSGRGF